MSSLVTLLEQANEIETKLIESGGQIDPSLEALIDLNSPAIKEKVDAYAAVVDGLNGRIEYAKTRLKEWNRVIEVAENAEANLKERLYNTLKGMGKTDLSGNEYMLKVQKNPPKVNVLNESAIPGKYLITETTTKPDKRLILEDLKMGFDVQGCEIVQGEKVVIKTSQRKLNGT